MRYLRQVPQMNHIFFLIRNKSGILKSLTGKSNAVDAGEAAYHCGKYMAAI